MINTYAPQTTLLANQHPDVMAGSPSALLAIFTEIIRDRFKAGRQLPWVWDGLPTPAAGTEGTASSARRILIEPAFSETAEVRNYRPAIYVDRGTMQPGKVAVANLAGQQISTGLRAFYVMAQVPITVQVEASRKGESSILADTVWFHLLGSVEQIRRDFDIQDMTPPQLGQTVPGEKDKTCWVTTIGFGVTLNLRWTTTPISPTLQQTTSTINDAQLLNYNAGG